MSYTKGQWVADVHKYEKKPKEIYLGIKVEIQPNYFVRLFDTILPETDEEYIKEHNEIKANVKLACDAPNLLATLNQIVNSPTPYNERELQSWYETARNLALDAVAQHSI